MKTSMMTRALELAERGWHVFPCTPGAKTPLGGHGQKDATTDTGQIIDWWSTAPNANIGVHCAPSGLYVVDIDVSGGKNGLDVWDDLTERHGHTETFTVRTPTGGFHFYYQMPSGEPLKNTAGKLGEHIDTRGNGYVVGPGSIRPEGTYEIVNSSEVAPLPKWIIDALTVKPRETATLDMTHATPLAGESEVEARVKELARELNSAPEGQGNHAAARIAFMVGGYVGAGQITRDRAARILVEDGLRGWSYATRAEADTMVGTIDRQIGEGALNPRPWTVSTVQAKPKSDDIDGISQGPVDTAFFADGKLCETVADQVLKGRYLYVAYVGWYLWSGKVWAPVEDTIVISAIRRWVLGKLERARQKTLSTPPHMIGDFDQNLKIVKEWAKVIAASKLSAVADLSRGVDGVYTEAAELDTHHELLNTPNGVVNLRTGQISKHDPALKITKMARGNYRPGHTHPDWEQALTALPEPLQKYMQYRIGQAATGYIPASDDALLLIGGGSNGKSMFTTDGVFTALGGYTTLANPNLLLKQQSGGPSPERFALRGARFVLLEELPEGQALNVAELKRIIGTSRITARNLHKNEVEFNATHTLAITSNYPPVINQTDEGTWRRLCVVPFEVRFVSGEPTAPNERKGDGGLRRRLSDGPEQIDAIMTWIVEGARMAIAQPDLIMPARQPDAIKEANHKARMNADRILGYVTERLVITDDREDMIAKQDVYADFTAWLEDHGHRPWSMETFHQRFAAHQACRKLDEGRTVKVADISRPTSPGVTFNSALPQLSAKPTIYRFARFNQETQP